MKCWWFLVFGLRRFFHVDAFQWQETSQNISYKRIWYIKWLAGSLRDRADNSFAKRINMFKLCYLLNTHFYSGNEISLNSWSNQWKTYTFIFFQGKCLIIFMVQCFFLILRVPYGLNRTLSDIEPILGKCSINYTGQAKKKWRFLFMEGDIETEDQVVWKDGAFSLVEDKRVFPKIISFSRSWAFLFPLLLNLTSMIEAIEKVQERINNA